MNKTKLKSGILNISMWVIRTRQVLYAYNDFRVETTLHQC